jgi:hypothetical protein
VSTIPAVRRRDLGIRRRLHAFDDRIQKIADADPMFGGDLEHRIEAQLIELHHARLRPPVVGFVDRDERRNVSLPGRLGNFHVPGHETFTSIYNQHQQIRGFHRATTAGEHQLVKRVFAGAEHAAGVDELERDALGGDVLGDHIAGGARHGRDDRTPCSGQPIEQRGLADIGATDENDGGKALRHGRWNRPSIS